MHAYLYDYLKYICKYKHNSLCVYFMCVLLAVVILKVCFLQNLYMTLIDLEGGAEPN